MATTANFTINISNQYHSYITFPLKHNIINITQDTLVSSASLDGDNYSWSHIFLDGQDFHNDLLLVEITDAHDNPLFADTVRYNADTCHFIIPSSHKKHIWEAWPDHNLENHLCPEDSHYVAIYQPSGYVYQTIINNERHYTYERDTIQLVESPG